MELWEHKGKAYNVTMEVGDMLMYESHSVVHGRPWPLKGK
jgi:prolyl 4-hydroxylase